MKSCLNNTHAACELREVSASELMAVEGGDINLGGANFGLRVSSGRFHIWGFGLSLSINTEDGLAAACAGNKCVFL
jgi:hypothetical protein